MRHLALVAGLALAAPALSSEFCHVPGKVEDLRQEQLAPWKAFREKRMDEVERHYGSVLARHQAGAVDDAYVSRVFLSFNCSDAYCEPLVLEWLRRHPGSAAARIALAHVYIAGGFAARGRELGHKTADSQFAAQQSAFRKALAELDQAERPLKNRSYVDSLRILVAPSMRGEGRTATELYRAALKSNPGTVQVRARYVVASTPRWGGSFEQMRSIVDDARALSASDRRYIDYLVLQEIGASYEIEKDAANAAAFYRRSISLCPGLDQSLLWLIELHRKGRDYAELEKSAAEYIARYPRAGWAYVSRGLSYVHRNRYPEALADFERGSQLGDGNAFMQLGGMYEMGYGVPRDYAKALELFLVAESHRVEGARQNIERVRKLATPAK